MKPKQTAGFALIASLSIMAVLVMIAVALYSLSSVATRSAEIASARVEAQANAKTSLMMAIGELQKHTGADTRVTAPATVIIDDPDPENNPTVPAVVGAWRSWEGLNHVRAAGDPARGRPVAEVGGTSIYDLKEEPGTTPNGRFISWLVSGANEGELYVGSDESREFPPSIVYNIPTTTTAGSETIPLLTAAEDEADGTGSLSFGDKNEIHVVPTEVDENTRYAWWVSPENQKARLQQPYSPRTQDVAGWADMAKSYSVPDPASFGLDEILDDPENYNPDGTSEALARKALNLASIELLKDNNTVEPQKRFHDFSTSAVGLLTNTATGGWRKDLSILTEKWDEIYDRFSGDGLPLFRYGPGEGETSEVPEVSDSNYDAEQSNFYPWSDYTQFGENQWPLTYNAASASWQSLVNFATKYKSIDYNVSDQTASTEIGWTSRISYRFDNNFEFQDSDFYGHYHEIELNPVVARVQFIIQANAFRDPDPDSSPDPDTPTVLDHRINLRIVPIFTLWNPYNVEIIKPNISGPAFEFGIGTMRSLPLALSVINGTESPDNEFEDHYKLINHGNTDGADGSVGFQDVSISGNPSNSHYGDLRAFNGWLPYEFSLKPGEVKVFTPEDDSATQGNGTHVLNILMKEGFETGDDFGIPLSNTDEINEGSSEQEINGIWGRLVKVPGRPNDELRAGDLVKFSVKADRLTKIFTDAVTTKSGAGAYFAVGTHKSVGGRTSIESGTSNRDMNHIRSVQAVNIDPDWAETYWPSDELVEIEYTVSDLIPDGNTRPWTNLYSISFGPRLTFGAAAGSPQNRPTKGLLQSNPLANNAFSIPEETAENHPANSAYDISYHSMTSGDGELTPEIGTSGYIATGFQVGDGLSRLVMVELPLRPVASLGELQHWDLRGNNPFPPYQFNLIGNSDATPLIERDSVLAGSPMETEPDVNLQHDDAYSANHLLFDDWFVSSIAPEPTTFGSGEARDIETVYEDFLRGDTQLTNRAYRPIPEDLGLSSSDASALTDRIVKSPDGDGWLKVASRLEVDGMFNVNSTSVDAWRALLGHARKQQVAYHSEDGMTLDTTERDHVVSRHTVASDVEASEATGIGAAFPSGSEYAGFRALNDDQLDELARLIVEQVRARGPFLSLSEFINRQLSLNTVDLPIAGADVNLSLAGALQTALDSLTEDPLAILKNQGENDQISSEAMDPSDPKLDEVGYAFEQAAEGFSTHGFPGWIRQADILRPIAPVLSARDDTFKIRAYGDKRDASGNVIARAWCEATVQRGRDFVDPSDEAESIDPPASALNQVFGRKYIITSFRWLNEDEV